MSGGYESTCPRCGAMLLTGGCLSCGYPAGTLRDRTAADTALAEKSKDDTPLGHVRIESLIESFENLAFVRQQLSDTKQQLQETKWECRNLLAERDEARRELAGAEELILYMLKPDLEKWVTTDRIMGVQRSEVERIVAYVDAHPAARRVRAKAEAAP